MWLAARRWAIPAAAEGKGCVIAAVAEDKRMVAGAAGRMVIAAAAEGKGC